jgi:hypothetical protein
MILMPMSAAIPIVKAALFAALAPLVEHDAAGLASVYWAESPLGHAATWLVFQSQDNGGKAEPMIGMRGWSGLITVKAYAPTDDAIDILLPRVELAMQTPAQPTGYRITLLETRPLTIPASDSIYAGGLLFRLAIYPA